MVGFKHVAVKRQIIILFCILIIGFSLRAGLAVLMKKDLSLYGDASNYQKMSHQIVEDGVYGYALGRKSGEPNAYVTPGYPLFLSAVYSIFRDPYLQIRVVRLLQAVIGGILTPLLAFLFVRRVFRRVDAALLTAGMTAFYPTYIRSSTLLLTEVLALFTMLLYFYLSTAGIQERRHFLNFLAGATFAMHVLIRPVMLPLFILPYIYGWYSWFKHQRKLLVKLFIQAMAGFLLLMLPWWIRNYSVMGTLVLTSTGSGDPLLAGSYPYMRGVFEDYMGSGKAVSQAVFARTRIIEGFTRSPGLYFEWYTLGKLKIMFLKPWLLFEIPILKSFHLIFHKAVLGIGTAGILFYSLFSKPFRMLIAYGILFLLLYLPFIPVDRYAYQHMFFLMLAASMIIAATAEKLRSLIKNQF